MRPQSLSEYGIIAGFIRCLEKYLNINCKSVLKSVCSA